jgi:uncharacterized OB-fold protein
VSSLPSVDPRPNSDTVEFWEATREGRLLLRRCRSCATVIWYPRPICPSCHGSDTEWFQATGRGSVYSYTVVHRSFGPWREATPYLVAYVELEEGPRLLTNLVDADPGQVRIGMPVTLRLDPTPSGHALPRFAPVSGEAEA